MKKAILTCILAAIIIATPASAKYSGGTGEPNTPYQIADANDLLAFAADTNDHDKYITLIADINLAGHNFTELLIPYFTGNFNGNNHIISNIYIFGYPTSYPIHANLGFFNTTYDAVIKNLTLENIDANSTSYYTYYAGGLVAHSYDSTIKNCKVTGSISTRSYMYSGGLVGSSDNSYIDNCSFKGSVIDSSQNAGGLVGANSSDSVITNSFSDVCIENTQTIGGFVALNQGQIFNCFAQGNIDTKPDSIMGGFAGKNGGIILNSACMVDANCPNGIYLAGGFIGTNYFSTTSLYPMPNIVNNCYCQATITIRNNCLQVGGFAGNNGSNGNPPIEPEHALGKCVIENCYSATSIILDNCTPDVGGFAGSNYDSKIINCCWDQQITYPQIIQSIGEDVNGTTENLFALSTAEMKTQASYSNWDFIEIWGIGENQTYPFLRRYQAADLNHDGIVNIADFAILANNWLKQ